MILSYLFPVFSMSSTNNPWFGATIGLVGLIAGYVIANGMNGISVALPSPTGQGGAASVAQVPTPPPSNDTPADADDDPVIGSDDATITVIEFTDYQCPFCSRHFEQTYSQIKQNYIDTGKVRYVSRDFPLGFHPFAQKAAEASECADDQGKFWEMHDKLFSTQAIWSAGADAIPTFKQYAADLGLNTGDFDSCLDNGTHAQEVKDDMADGSASGIDGTPGFWILGPDGNNQKISGAYPYETFSAAFDGMLE
jgi:protein-disulfide isomerase